ncbi:MAG: NAD(P)H-dependent glycerol-3-phosphate dehydrogenase [Flammeovirgaceae bacterium]
MDNRKRIAVIGNGSWATALAKILAEQDVEIKWWVRVEDDIPHIKKYHQNPSYLRPAKLNLDRITPIYDIKEVVKEVDYVFIVVPSAFIESSLEPLSKEDFDGKKVITSVKGMIPDLHCTVSEYVCNEFGVTEDRAAVVAGPCHAEEVAMERLSYLTIASANETLAQEGADMLKCRYIATKISTDMYGVEYCAVMKNIFAVACGIAHGLNYGDNFQAVLVTNATREARRFLNEAYPLAGRDLNLTAYLGDILVTCYSQFSRNRTFGNMIGRGYTVKSAQMEMEMVAEGYYAVNSIYELNKEHAAKMNITRAVYNVLYEKISPIIEFHILSEKLT